MPAALLVADSGPLIALARLDLLRLPSRLYPQVWVTVTVWDEVTRAPRPQESDALTTALQNGWIAVVEDPSPPTQAPFDPRLDDGERSALALAQAHHAAVLIDERLGRAAALAAGLPVLGTLGVLVRARELGLLPRLRPLIDSLTGSGYFISRAIAEQALAAVGE